MHKRIINLHKQRKIIESGDESQPDKLNCLCREIAYFPVKNHYKTVFAVDFLALHEYNEKLI